MKGRERAGGGRERAVREGGGWREGERYRERDLWICLVRLCEMKGTATG